MPEPADLTPADTSSMVAPGLGRALRTRFASVDEVVVSALAERRRDRRAPGARRRRSMPSSSGRSRRTAGPRRPRSSRRSLATGVPTIAVALRTPWDLATYPAGVPAICTYSILRDSLEALARALAGEIGFPGRLPVPRSRQSPRGYAPSAR